MREMVREVMAEPGLAAPTSDVREIKGQVQTLRSEFASIRAEFMSMLRGLPRLPSRGAVEAPRTAADERTPYALCFAATPPRELLFGRPIPPFSVAFADPASAAGLPATKLVCTLCRVDSEKDVAQVLFGESEVIMRGGVAHFTSLALGRLAWMKRGGVYRLKLASVDPSCPYRIVTLFTPPINVRTKPSKRATSICAPAPPPEPQHPQAQWTSRPASWAAPAPPAPVAPRVPQVLLHLQMPAQAAALLKRKPASNVALDSSASPTLQPLQPVDPRGGNASWMEQERPSAKKPTGHADQVSSLAGDMIRVGIGPNALAAANDGSVDDAHRQLRAAEHRDGVEPPPPFLSDKAGSQGSTMSALQRLGSSGLMELALSVFGHESREALHATASPARSPRRTPQQPGCQPES
jgi:hypothetical protein